MLYRKIPKSGDELSILGFGCMRLPTTRGGKIDDPRATRQVLSAIDRGVNYLDTAWSYHAGESENFLGRALAHGYRDKVKLATKLPSWMIKYRTLMKVGCTGCGYCLPCPSDVAIPRCFDVYNKLHMFGNVEEAKLSYAAGMGGLVKKTTTFASQCVQCGECLEKCPQHIEIPESLEKVAEELEDTDLEGRIAFAKKMLNMD